MKDGIKLKHQDENRSWVQKFMIGGSLRGPMANDAQQMTNDYLRSSTVSILMAFTTCIALSIA